MHRLLDFLGGVIQVLVFISFSIFMVISGLVYVSIFIYEWWGGELENFWVEGMGAVCMLAMALWGSLGLVYGIPGAWRNLKKVPIDDDTDQTTSSE